MDDKAPNENGKEEEDTMDIINIDKEAQKNIGENKQEIKEQSLPEKHINKKERSPFSLSGAKLPLSIYTRRTFDISLLNKYLKDNSSSGICGSINLGNTCYMNSSIACISNCTELTYYFLSGQYKDDINYHSNYGLKGKLAEIWYDLLHEYWIDNTDKGNPKDLKYIIGEKDIRFRGYNQQDSNEFINIFLDILNEDLNFSEEKKYIELEEKKEGEKDEECAKRFWEANLIRNDSVITDLFCGLFKSTITCPKCNKVSITFEPFYSINLPLKEKKKKNRNITKKNLEEYKIYYIPKYGIRTTFCINIHNIPNTTLIGECKEILLSSENFDYKDILNNVKYFQIGQQINNGEIEEDAFIDPFFNLFLYEIINTKENNELKIPIYFVYSKPSGALELSEYPRIIFCDNNVTLREFRKQIYFLSRKYILSPFINFGKEKLDFLSIEITKYRKDKSIKDDYIFNLIDEEFERIFDDNIIQGDIIYLKDYIKNAPFKLTLRELMGNQIIQIFKADKPNELTDEFKDLTGIEDIYSSINEILDKLRGYVVSVEFNWFSKYINKQNYTFNSRNTISIQFPKSSEEEKKLENEEKEEEFHKQNLEECFNFFCKEEKLKFGNEWYCNKCKEHLLAKKKIDLFYLPKILIINFKRFIKESQVWEKNDEDIDFPINNFNMKDLIIGPDKEHSIYDLFAVSQHYGGTGGGHYTAVCKNGDKWYSYDDSYVTQTSPLSCLSSSAYVLFYRRQTD